MASLTGDHRTTRWMTIAATLLVIGVLVVGISTVVDDYLDRRDQRAAVAASGDSVLAESLERLQLDVGRTATQAQDLATQLQQSVDGLGPGRDLSGIGAAVSSLSVAETVPSIDRIIYQNAVAEAQALDRFGSPIQGAITGFDTAIALNRAEPTVFSIAGEDLGDTRTFLSYLPLDDGASWLVLVFRGDELAAGSRFEGLASSNEASAQVDRTETSARLEVAQPFFGSALEFVEERDVTVGAPASWIPLFLKALGALLAFVASIAVALNLGKLHRRVGKRIDNVRTTESGSSLGFEQNIVGIVELDEGGVIVDANQAYCEQVRRSRDELVGESLLSFTDPADRGRHLAVLDKVISGGADTAQVEHRVHTRGEKESWVLEHLSRSETVEGSTRVLIQSQDITFRRYATWELAKQALHDELTGLPNRAMIMHRLKSLLESGAEEGLATLVGVMFIDVDRFKTVNDSLGHDVGDQLICHVGEKMSTAVRAGDTVSRFGGDEFVVLLDQIAGVSEALAVAERIRSAVSDPFQTANGPRHQTLSVGVAFCRPGELTADELLRDADAAMYRAKELGRNRVEVFDEGMRQVLDEQLELETELEDAIDAGEMAMYFQPIVEAETYSTAGFESLIRWPHPRRGLLTPGQFLPIAEEAGLQAKLDSLALRKTCHHMAMWASKYPLANELYVSANKVPKNFKSFVEAIEEIVASTGLPPELLVVEVVENALLDDADGALQAIDALKEMGVRVAIDDFGTGYSSLSYLTQFRPTTLKIDRAFVKDLPQNEDTASVVQAITEMALALEINVIAEGVETWEQAEALNAMGVPYFQGYLFGKPRPADEIEAWFESNTDMPVGEPESQRSGARPVQAVEAATLPPVMHLPVPDAPVDAEPPPPPPSTEGIMLQS